MNLEIEYIQLVGKQSFHTGIDLAGEWHTNIMSVLDGKVVSAGVQGAYGNCVKIEHQYKDETIYFISYKEFDTAKVMVWESLGNMKPICDVENVELQ